MAVSPFPIDADTDTADGIKRISLDNKDELLYNSTNSSSNSNLLSESHSDNRESISNLALHRNLDLKEPEDHPASRKFDTGDVESEFRAETKTTSGKVTLDSFLHKQLSITLIDRRIIVGHLICVDGGMNIILNDTTEYRPLYPRPRDELSQEEIRAWDEFRENRETYWPVSDPFQPSMNMNMNVNMNGNRNPTMDPEGEDSRQDIEQEDVEGWWPRSIGMVCVKGKDVKKIEMRKEVWEDMEREGVAQREGTII
ncbi:uncharacterized protein I303_100624 [Kwoniella dejecticola CBS 10117]|uniref:Sm domain-containing protein n=1 Tax=Kwoniella dejecticola CBS 10117 TaxID=1296121 RepID=A0A1A6AFG3_9TREE|nr:uncharacterized protein I303_00627 [Kwoniella dejecticola CBS 10117]OBR88810.1 hypothetical protein I303_00627 [Kwoniella dejecticola CBS 10117]